MKRFFRITMLTAGLLIWSLNAGAQECDTYFPYKEGTVLELTHYSAKDKEEGKTSQTVVSRKDDDDGFDAVIRVSYEGQKASERFESEFNVNCSGGTLRFDMRQFVNNEMLSAYKDMEVDVQGTDLQIPAKLSVGQQLPDGEISMKMSSQGMGAMNMTVHIINRKVEGKETLTTPMGSFECYKVVSDVETRMVVGMKSRTEEWIAEGLGVIKSASYSKGGKLTGYSMLTAVRKP